MSFFRAVITVDVDDIDSALAKIEQLGGKTVRPRQDIGGEWAIPPTSPILRAI